MKRRQFLSGMLAGVGGMMFGCGDGGTGPPAPAGGGALLEEGAPLRILASLANQSGDPAQFAATLTAAPGEATLLPGQSTGMLLYNGSIPGPLIELREEQHVRIVLENGLAQDSTIHWHGLAVPPDQDGNPMDPVHAGTRRIYEYDVPAGSAGTYWYHPHPDANTAAQVARDAMQGLLVRWGCEVMTAGTGDEAVRCAREKRPDVILCDLSLADSENGVEVVDRVRGIYGTAVACAFVTGESASDRVALARKSGHPIAFKPTTPGKLRAMLEHLVQSA